MGYQIAYDCIVDGKEVLLYHQGIKVNDDATAMNVYKEVLTNDQDQAMTFYSREEATGVASLFENEFLKPFLIAK